MRENNHTFRREPQRRGPGALVTLAVTLVSLGAVLGMLGLLLTSISGGTRAQQEQIRLAGMEK